MAVLDELLVGLGFDYDDEDLESFQSDLDKTTDLVKKFAGALVAGTAALFGFAAATTSASDEQGKMAEEVGVAVDTLDALQFANRRAGGTAEGLSSSLQQLSVRIGETARGVGSGIEAFGLLGISVTDANGKLKSTDQLLLEVSDKFQDLSKSQQIELAEKLGLRDSIRLLQQGSAGIQDLIKEANELGVTTAKDAEIAAEFQDSLTDIWQIVKQLSRTIAMSLVPILQDVADGLTEWWKDNKDLIAQRMPEFIEKAAFAIKLLTAAAVAFIAVKFVGLLASMVAILKTATLSALAFNAAVMALPLFIAGVIAAIGLLAEDAQVFFEGGESFIGSMIEKYPQWESQIRGIAKVFKFIAKVFKFIADLVGMIIDGWSMLIDLFSDDNFGRDLKLVFEQLWRDFKAMIDNMLDSVGEFFSGMWDDFKAMIDRMLDTITGFFSSMAEKATGAFHTITFGAFEDDEEEAPTPAPNIITIAQGVATTAKVLGPVVEELTKDINVEDIEAAIGFDIPELPEFSLDNVMQTIGFDMDELDMMDNAIINGLAVPANDDVKANNEVVPGSFTPGDVSNTSNITNTSTFQGGINITVDGSGTPEETARVIREELRDMTEQASNDLNSAVRL